MFIGSNKNDEEDDSDDEEDYSPDCESGNEDSDEDDISGLFDDSSFLKDNSKEKESTPVSDSINDMTTTANNSNTSSVIEGFARIHVRDDDFLTELRVPFIQYTYIENDKKYIDIDCLVMNFPKKIFGPEGKDGGKGSELGIVCPKLLSNKLKLTSTKDVNNNSNQVKSFKEVSDKLHVAHDWSKELLGRPQYVRLKFEC